MSRLFKNILLCAVTLIVSLGTSHAAPTLTGSLFYSVNSDKAFYRQGDVENLWVTLKNTTGSTFTGSVNATITGRGVQVGGIISASVTGLKNNATASVRLSIPTVWNGNYRGYYVQLAAVSGATTVDTAAAALDQSSDWTTYPRQCWGTNTWTSWGGAAPVNAETPEESVSGFNAWHCNNLQMYGQLYRWHQPYYPGAFYTNGNGEVQSQNLIERYLETARRYRMGTLAYVPMYAVNSDAVQPNFLNDGSGTQLAWGAFTSACGSACKLSDVYGFPGGAPADTTTIGVMDPTNAQWKTYWAQQVGLWLQRYRFDGVFIDTYGTFNGTVYNNAGTYIPWDNAYSGFMNTVQATVNVPMVLNPASPWNEQDLAQNTHEAYHFVERWDHSDDISNYGVFWTRAQQVWGWANRKPNSIGLDWDMGINKNLNSNTSCTTNGGQNVCYFNLPGMLYMEAAMFSSGAHHAWLADGNRFISNDDFPVARMLSATPETIAAEYDYQTFDVAYEKLLRNNISASMSAAPSITSGATGSATAGAGSVYLLNTMRSGLNILHLLNYQQLNATQFSDVSDPDANYPAPTVTGALGIKMYVTSGTLGNLYMASPDINHGAPQQLTYTTGSDSSGSYITFTVPSLKYWDMVWLEVGIVSSDYAAP